MLQRYLIELSYNGTPYHGWQVQPNAVTVQGTVNNALSKLFGEEIESTGSGRTDTGVHALKQYLHFDTEKPVPTSFLYRLNGMIPESIAVKCIWNVSDEFHARFSAERRGYVYKIHFDKNPFLTNTSWKLNARPNVELMNICAEMLLYHTAYSCFAKSGSWTDEHTCSVFFAEWSETSNGIEFNIHANRFMRGMVRAIVGTLIEVGLGKTSLEQWKSILKSDDRTQAGQAAPAHGLYLNEVVYPEQLWKQANKL